MIKQLNLKVNDISKMDFTINNKIKQNPVTKNIKFKKGL